MSSKDYNISLNLDDKLSQFKSLTFTKELINKYYELYGQDHYLARLDNSEKYYKELLETRYNTFYRLSGFVDMGRKLTYSDLYYIASNAYYMKGSEYALWYALDNIGIEVNSITYPRGSNKEIVTIDGDIAEIDCSDQYNIKIKVSVTISDGDNYLVQDYINQLAYELLFMNSTQMGFEVLFVPYDIDTEIIIKQTWINSNDLESSQSEYYLIGDDKDSNLFMPTFNYGQNVIEFDLVPKLITSNDLDTDAYLMNGIDYEPLFNYNQFDVELYIKPLIMNSNDLSNEDTEFINNDSIHSFDTNTIDGN